MRVLVCGGRDYRDRKRVFAVLDEVAPETIIHGGARGADTCADIYAVVRDLPLEVYAADWTMGPAAGPTRNQRMLDRGKPDLVIAFPGGRGTADMVRRARKAGVLVREIKDEAPPLGAVVVREKR